MIRTVLNPVLWVFMMVSIGQLQAAVPQGYDFKSLTEAIKEATTKQKPLLIYFARYGCSTCNKMKKEVFIDNALKEKYNRDFVLAYVDTESGNRIQLHNGEYSTEMQFAARSRILGTPTFFYFSPAMQPLLKKTGFQSIEKMATYADFIGGGHYQKQSLKQFIGKN